MSAKRKGGRGGGRAGGPSLSEAAVQAITGETMKLQGAMETIQRKLAQLDNQAQRNVREQRRLELTGREVASLPEGTRTFRSVGKAFMQYERAEVVASLQEERAELEKETKTLESQRTYMMRQQRECEANLRELAASLMRG